MWAKFKAWVESYEDTNSNSPINETLLPLLQHITEITYQGKRLTPRQTVYNALAALESGGLKYRKTYFRLKTEVETYRTVLYATAHEDFYAQDSQRSINRSLSFTKAYFASIRLNDIFGALWAERGCSSYDPRFEFLRAIEYHYQQNVSLQATQKRTIKKTELLHLITLGKTHNTLVEKITQENKVNLEAVRFAQEQIEVPRVAITKALKMLSLEVRSQTPGVAPEVLYYLRLREELLKIIKILVGKLNHVQEGARNDIIELELEKAQKSKDTFTQVWSGEAVTTSLLLYEEALEQVETSRLHAALSQNCLAVFTSIQKKVTDVLDSMSVDTEKRRLGHLQQLFLYLQKNLQADIEQYIDQPVVDDTKCLEKHAWLYQQALLADLGRCMTYILGLCRTPKTRSQVLYEQIAKLESDTFDFMKVSSCADALFEIEHKVAEKLLPILPDYLGMIDLHVKTCDEYITESFEFHLKELDKQTPLPIFQCPPALVDISQLHIQTELEILLPNRAIETFRKVVGTECPFKILWEAVSIEKTGVI